MSVPHPRSRRRALGLVLALSVAALSTGAASAAVNPLAQSPTVNRTHVVFAWGGYLWSASRAGGTARRLTYGGHEGKPIFSPDGKWIAYSGQYDGVGFISATRADVYVIPAEGGKPRRITWHPGADLAVGWTPDSRRILFRSNREAFALFDRLYTVPVEGGAPQVLPLPRGEEGSFSPDAARVAYVPNAQWQPYFKRYRGGQTTPIQLARLDTLEIEKVPRRNSNDSQPVWIGDKVYFLSDRDGPVSLYAYDTKTKAVRRLIDNHGLDLTSLTAGPDVLVYEQFGDVFLFDPATGRSRKVDLRIDETPAATRPRSVTLGDKAEPVALSASPDGRRALVEARGEILEFSLGEGAPRPAAT
jgi:tricorn protease